MNENNYEVGLEIWRIQKLFRAVLDLAADDAFGLCRLKKGKNKAVNDAKEFFDSYFDLALVCRLANVDFYDLRKIVKNPNTESLEKYYKIKHIIRTDNGFL